MSNSRQRLISDFLPPKTYPTKLQLAFIGSVASTRLALVFNYQFTVPDLPPKTKLRLKSSLSREQLIYTFAAVVFILGFGIGLVKISSQQPKALHGAFTGNSAYSQNRTQKQAMAIVGLPARLEIPTIKVDAALDYVGVTPKGELGVSAGPTNAAWYDQGPRPGQTGNAIIDGHFGYKNHIPAVFDNLHTLKKGDKLYVKDIKGLTTTFVVRQLRTYSPDDYASAVFRSSDGKAHLNLITCQGDWNQAQKSYSTRLVVFADKETQ
jgi:LPXTG-site transpeptidase (sortase) family protein